jgi:hypothetical protein
MRYRAIYAIDVEAESSLEAVLQAYATLLSPERPIFDVYIGDCHIAQIDLADLPSAAEARLDERWSPMSLALPRTSAA